jgi:hypothetical protein
MLSGKLSTYSLIAPRATGGESRRVERVLATARLFLASSALLAIYLDPTQPTHYAAVAYGLLALYLLYSLLLFVVLPRKAEPSARFSQMTHVADVIWPVAVTLFTAGPDSPFFVLFSFVLLAAAYRWGFHETLLTALAAVALLFVEALLVSFGSEATPLLQGEFELNRLIMRSTTF